MEHKFMGSWISDEEMAALAPRNVFHRQLEPLALDCSAHRNRHVLFRRRFSVDGGFSSAKLYITADDYYKLYINGRFVGQGPAPSYHFHYNYNVIDVGKYLVEGENLIAVHTLYQGLVNRVWQSGDNRHGLLCDLEIDGRTVLSSDERFLVSSHTGYREVGVCGYQTQFLEEYDSRSAEVGFERTDFDDRVWRSATVCRFDDHEVVLQNSKSLVFEELLPVRVWKSGNCVRYDFGANYVGYLSVRACGKDASHVTVRCAQELEENGALRYSLRANCVYEEDWILSGGEDTLDWFDYKTFRYAELELDGDTEVRDVRFVVRHYPFALRAELDAKYADNAALRRIWDLCVHTQKYGVQEVIQDCMEREKGFYLGDGCYTALAHMILSGDDSMVRKLIDDAFRTDFITDTLVTCMDCSHMQEIAEFPLIMISLLLWHYRLTGDREYLSVNYEKAVKLLDAYRRDYERDGLLRDLDKWCVVEWPKNFQQGYDADIREGQVCTRAHISINAYYFNAVCVVNAMAGELGKTPYRDPAPLRDTFVSSFYDPARALFVDSEGSEHVTLVGNSFAYAFGLCPDGHCREEILKMLDAEGIDSLSLFCTFPMLMGLTRDGEERRLLDAMLCEGAWLRMLREGASTTFEGWGKETKKNASLFHLTMSYVSVFLANVDQKRLFAL